MPVFIAWVKQSVILSQERLFLFMEFSHGSEWNKTLQMQIELYIQPVKSLPVNYYLYSLGQRTLKFVIQDNLQMLRIFLKCQQSEWLYNSVHLLAINKKHFLHIFASMACRIFHDKICMLICQKGQLCSLLYTTSWMIWHAGRKDKRLHLRNRIPRAIN